MYKHVNSASRIHQLLTKAFQQQSDKAVFLVWAEIFGIKKANDVETAQLVTDRLHWLYTELQLLERQVCSANLSPHLYEETFARIKSILSPLNLPVVWNGVRGNLTPDALLALAFINELLPDEESKIDEEELIVIANEVTELSESLGHSKLPDRLKQLILHHIELIQEALTQYQVFGAKALREVARTALGEIIESKDIVAPEQESNEISKLGKIWERVNKAADFALKAEHVEQVGQRAWQALSTWLQS